MLMLAPLAPHLAEELWEALGHPGSLAYERWPEYEERYTRDDTVEVPVQVNGRVRGRVVVPASAGREDIEKAALADPAVLRHVGGGTIRKVIVVPGKLVNIVVGQ